MYILRPARRMENGAFGAGQKGEEAEGQGAEEQRKEAFGTHHNEAGRFCTLAAFVPTLLVECLNDYWVA